MEHIIHGSVRRIGYGIALWAIPYAVSIPLLSLRTSDPLVFKSILVVVATILESLLAVLYFKKIQGDYLRESIILAVTWMVVNWLLDFAGIIPFAGISVARYFMEIGVEYIGMAAPVLALGYLLELKTKKTI